MPRSVLVGSFTSPKMEFAIDMGNPFFNRTVDGFLKIGAVVGASKVLAEETYDCLRKGSISKGKFEDALKKMCKEGAYWGTVAGVYVGMEYGMERIRGTRDWKNAMLGGALTGALISAASNNGRDKVIRDAITAGAVATAAELVCYLT
ncbi:Outer envelope pore protein 16, chloroplastic [Ananas comosus]|uniref:Outer envelope pore protein 16, chloroplastic n=1 Tax=Ananas comosus TaxID=4615 RepID=A0A199VCM3_ANACO|nr:Outer envelope pore protein 16, chloroplastic [Ananas comosus]